MPDDTKLELARKQIEFARTYTRSLLADIEPNDWYTIPAGCVSHVAWQVGHLAMAQYGLCLFRIRGRQPIDTELMSSAFRKKFSRGTTPDPDPANNPSIDEIKQVFDRVYDQAMAEMAGYDEATLGEPVDMPFAELRLLMPTAQRVAKASPAALAKIGVTSARARTLLGVSRAMAQNPNLLEPGADVEQAIARLKALPGIGEWTAQYLAMRAFSWPDAFPATDLGIRKALGIDDERKIIARAEIWRPWRGYAAMHLWRTLA